MDTERKRWMRDWSPDVAASWKLKGKRIAWRNLVWSILAENVGLRRPLLIERLPSLAEARA